MKPEDFLKLRRGQGILRGLGYTLQLSIPKAPAPPKDNFVQQIIKLSQERYGGLPDQHAEQVSLSTQAEERPDTSDSEHEEKDKGSGTDEYEFL